MDKKTNKHKEDKMEIAKVNLDIDCAAVEKSITEFFAREFELRGKTIAVLGLSGGVDSALVAFLCKKAELDLYAVLMPCGTDQETSDSSLDAYDLCADISVPGDHIVKADISYAVNASDMAIYRCLPPAHQKLNRKLDSITLGNNKARQRMVVLYELARRLQGLVVGTENRSEYLLGYFTLYGDQAADINPIAGLWKTQVRALAKHIGVPREILKKAPSAGLWPGQTDEGELGFTYDEADRVLASMTENYFGHWPNDFKNAPQSRVDALVERICSQSDVGCETVLKVLEAVKQTEYKRKTPPAWSLEDLS